MRSGAKPEDTRCSWSLGQHPVLFVAFFSNTSHKGYYLVRCWRHVFIAGLMTMLGDGELRNHINLRAGQLPRSLGDVGGFLPTEFRRAGR